MPTIAEFARTLGVSKSNVVNKIKELDLETVTKPGDKRRCQYLPERTCSALADKLAKTKPAVQADETRLLDLYQAQVEPLKSANASLQKQVQLLMDQLTAAEKAGAETARQSQAHIDDLKVQVERLEAENRDLKSQLSLSRASRASISPGPETASGLAISCQVPIPTSDASPASIESAENRRFPSLSTAARPLRRGENAHENPAGFPRATPSPLGLFR